MTLLPEKIKNCRKALVVHNYSNRKKNENPRDQFRDIQIPHNTKALRTRLWGINPTNSNLVPRTFTLVWGRGKVLGTRLHKFCSFSPEPRTEVYCFRWNFNISKLIYAYVRMKLLSFRKYFTHPSLGESSPAMQASEFRFLEPSKDTKIGEFVKSCRVKITTFD